MTSNIYKDNYDIIIIGAGMVGLSLAHQLKINNNDISILIIDKEYEIGLHSSGRNSGVLHSGIYYKPNTLKSKICIKGAKRLKSWCKENNLKVLECGKVITPQNENLDSQLDVLYKRGLANGADVSIIDIKEFQKLVPYGRTSSGRAIWSPNTCVVNPKQILKKLVSILRKKSVDFLLGEKILNIDQDNSKVKLNTNISYKYLFNCAGLESDLIAKKFGLCKNKLLLPFKGIYWKLSNKCPFNFTTNLYPIPDLSQPFLGIHITPSTDGEVYLGPTAVPALGRENYYGLEDFDPWLSLKFLSIISEQFIKNKNGFRNYATQQSLQGIKPLFVQSAKMIVPSLKSEYLIKTKKVGIRPQLYDYDKGKLLNDFRIEKTSNSLHVLNAISPAFTASFEFADFIINESSLFN